MKPLSVEAHEVTFTLIIFDTMTFTKTQGKSLLWLTLPPFHEERGFLFHPRRKYAFPMNHCRPIPDRALLVANIVLVNHPLVLVDE